MTKRDSGNIVNKCCITQLTQHKNAKQKSGRGTFIHQRKHMDFVLLTHQSVSDGFDRRSLPTEIHGLL